MKISAISLAVIGLISGALTIHATSDVDRACINVIGSVREKIGDWFVRIDRSVCRTEEAEATAPSPGDTWVLVASQGMITGLDREGCVTWYDSVCGICDLPALTGFPPVEGKPGDMVSTPEVVLGLTIIRAFERSPGLMNMLSEVNLANIEHPKATFSGGVLVELGHGDYVSKVARLSQILLQARQLDMHIGRIDLRFAGQVVVECDWTRRGFDKEV